MEREGLCVGYGRELGDVHGMEREGLCAGHDRGIKRL